MKSKITNMPAKKKIPTNPGRGQVEEEASSSSDSLPSSDESKQPETRAAKKDPNWYVKNPNWRLTDAGEQVQTSNPWWMVSLAFGVPLIMLFVFGFLFR